MESIVPAIASMGALTIALIVGSVLCSIVFTVVPIFFVIKVMRNLSAGKAQNAAILQSGLPGKAKILQLGTGGMTVRRGVQRSVQLNVTLEVQLGDGSAPFQAQIAPLVPEIAMASLQPGQEVPVRVSASDRSQVAIDLPAMGFVV